MSRHTHDMPFHAYHLQVREANRDTPPAEADAQYVAIMQTADEAVEVVKALRRRPGSIEVIAQDDGVMLAAKRRGLGKGDVCALRSEPLLDGSAQDEAGLVTPAQNAQ